MAVWRLPMVVSSRVAVHGRLFFAGESATEAGPAAREIKCHPWPFQNIMHLLIQSVFDFNDQVSLVFVILGGSEKSHGFVQ